MRISFDLAKFFRDKRWGYFSFAENNCSSIFAEGNCSSIFSENNFRNLKKYSRIFWLLKVALIYFLSRSPQNQAFTILTVKFSQLQNVFWSTHERKDNLKWWFLKYNKLLCKLISKLYINCVQFWFDNIIYGRLGHCIA